MPLTNFARLALLVPLAVCAGCLENTETITVQPDGALRVELRAKGSVEDLADGYPLPLHGPWTTDDETTRAWMQRVGRDTGSAATRANAASLPESPESGGLLDREGDEVLCVTAEFARAADLPHFHAPRTDPYQTAYLRRDARLSIEHKGTRTVYVFERTLHGRTFERYDVWAQMKKVLRRELAQRVESGEVLDPGEIDTLARLGETALRQVARAQAEDALTSLWTDGRAELAVEGQLRVLAGLDAALERLVTAEELRAILSGLLDRARLERDQSASAERLVVLERELRETLRRTLTSALDAESVPLAARNAVLGQLESSITAVDQTGDLGDESFVTRVRMPGTIVGGNHLRLEEGAAVFEVAGLDLRDRTHVLRVVSVVE